MRSHCPLLVRATKSKILKAYCEKKSAANRRFEAASAALSLQAYSMLLKSMLLKSSICCAFLFAACAALLRIEPFGKEKRSFKFSIKAYSMRSQKAHTAKRKAQLFKIEDFIRRTKEIRFEKKQIGLSIIEFEFILCFVMYKIESIFDLIKN